MLVVLSLIIFTFDLTLIHIEKIKHNADWDFLQCVTVVVVIFSALDMLSPFLFPNENPNWSIIIVAALFLPQIFMQNIVIKMILKSEKEGQVHLVLVIGSVAYGLYNIISAFVAMINIRHSFYNYTWGTTEIARKPYSFDVALKTSAAFLYK